MSLGKILVVEDEALLREILCEWLETEGYTALPAADGREALRLVEAEGPDLIATDVRMPVMDGLTLLQKLKALPGRVPPAVLMSGHAGTALRDTYDLGVEEVLAKPFTDSQFLATVRRRVTPAEKRWQLKSAPTESQALEAIFAAPNTARDTGALAFGRGGFCLRSADPLRAGPVRFDLQFVKEATRIAGEGLVKWIEPAEGQVGVEIAGLYDDSLEYGIRLTAGSGARSYIPRSSLSPA